MELMTETQVAVVSDTFHEFVTLPRSQTSALLHVNVLDHKNDEQLERLLDHFDLWQAII